MRRRRGAGLRACAAVALALTSACHPTPTPASAHDRPSLQALPALVRDIDQALAQPSLEHGYWGVLVKSLKSGETLYALNQRKLMMPASNLKIVTLAVAAERLGWDYSYETRVFAAGPVESGTLRGDLVVVGSGDPSLMEQDGEVLFAEWADRLRSSGIRTIAGRIIGNDNAFDDDGLGFGWSWDDLADDYAAGVSALQFNENAVRVTVAAGPAAGDWAGLSVSPAGSGLDLVNSVRTTAAGAATSISAHRLPGSMRLELRGTMPVGAPSSALTVSVDNPTLFFVASLRRALIAHGIDVRGPAVDIDDVSDAPAPEGTPLAIHRSPPLSTLAARLMKVSQNLYAETLLKTIGASSGSATADNGRRQMAAALKAWGIGDDGLILRDGSGLSRYDYVTAEALVTILVHVAQDERLRGPFQSSLPIAGREGTLANRMKGTAAEGNARAKSGSMSNVRGLSGYVTSASGEPLVFAILANNFDGPTETITKTVESVVVRLATFAR